MDYLLPDQPPSHISPRFTLELEFVLALGNPQYLHWLSYTYPHLFNPPASSNPKIKSTNDGNTDADKFARYLAYLYNYWREPKYSQYLTHPTATLWILSLLQHEQFRKDVVRIDVIERLQAELYGMQERNAHDETVKAELETNNAVAT
ncbi:hypothetical protein BT93_L1297 [Corymbia citriodora subsp. variegata]|uniref:Mediator of RNA polymerase II transcription subunit 31 n=1 Tax=Corymbia citriodora subsp. variegata TaxID=360336 RepID=A0A8T0CHW3_CORYI|nr:hypothetical protein BT93_L1297 [Corymbia citriodora subsp. variegata]